MDTENPPQVLPNGYVYSSKVRFGVDQYWMSKILVYYFDLNLCSLWQALEEMAKKNNGKITCPRTGFVCNYKDLVKAYIS
ncbi:hypothetical protein L484_017254 [Morus notabilis]|uniref:Uncharacterized protein n=1 Tax=Morus notabilis TaxID=981085 RepID=W9RFK4_9ROSA|nr:hypothetical protein L484_017254 [Morus notabilis]